MEKIKIPSFIENTISNASAEDLARVIVEHRERYVIQCGETTMQAEITGNIRFSARSRADFPAVGDWVRITRMDEQTAIILEVLPRFSMLSRQAIGRQGEEQIIASNIDVAFIVQAVGHDFNLNRLERYLSICLAAGIRPVMLLTKIDLIEASELNLLTTQIRERKEDLDWIAISSETGEGYERLQAFLDDGKTYCFMGSSGVGKSTIINHLMNEEVLKTAEISMSTSKGRHTTSHRELFILPNGSMVIDTPGMRELGMTDKKSGIEMTYDQITKLAEQCRYADCTHTSEIGCAVQRAVEIGDLQEEVYENYLKLLREQAHFTTSVHEKHRKDKEFGRLIKAAVKDRKRKKF